MITLNGLTKHYGQDVIAVDDLSLSVAAGEVYGLLGPNGAGKTTTLRMVLGLLEPTRGDASILGHSVSTDPMMVKRQIGLVSASAGLYQWLTPREMLHYFATAYGLSKSRIADRTKTLTELMDLGRFLDRRCATLSTGQKQRVNLARALVHDPPVVLLDEPTRGLDVVGSQVVFDYTDLLRSEGKAIVVCTHQLDEAERLCDRFGLLHHGRLRYEGTLPELTTTTGCESLVAMFLRLLENKQISGSDS
ncbi:ABC transporter ATP-binding protein [Thalassoroseus pseudoceratinae]|uniref:ABC transporter ATP-binding protein n=1 Tax=Thalassoroseus pseudoceratinae TaxID=2713176 RepID=UPI001422EAF3|nr:ATP-binding cassette domain-containing protein [Thalassoroseus pseudoceratinae]